MKINLKAKSIRKDWVLEEIEIDPPPGYSNQLEAADSLLALWILRLWEQEQRALTGSDST